MKTLLYVLLPASTDAFDLEDAFYALLKPYHLDQSSDEIQPDWKYDYLCLFDPTLNCPETEAELPCEVGSLYRGTISKVSRLRTDARASALVTPDGTWHDVSDFGWTLLGDPAVNEVAIQEWQSYYSKRLQENFDCWVIETWAHS